MGYVKLKPKGDINFNIVDRFGGKATRPAGRRVLARAKSLADARAKHTSVAKDIDLSMHAHGSHTEVMMSVMGHHEDGSPSGQVATYLEFGYYNEWAQRFIPGKHIMRDAKRAA